MDTLFRWLYSDAYSETEDHNQSEIAMESDETSQEQSGRHIAAWIIVCIIIVLTFVAGFSVGYFIRIFEIIDCPSDPPLPKPHQFREWNGFHSIGTFSYYKCSDAASAPLSDVFRCHKSKKWRLIFSINCECPFSPLKPVGLSVYENSGLAKHIGHMVTYKCNPSICSPISSTHVCSQSRTWQQLEQYTNTNSSHCYCNKTVPVDEHLARKFLSALNKTENTAGSTVQVHCTNETDSIQRETYLCTEAAVWLKIRNSSCLCEENPPNALLSTHLRKWNNTIESRKIGTVITYHCTDNPNSHIYKTVSCDKQLKWSVLMEETGHLICKNRYHVETNLLDFENAKKTCEDKGGNLLKTQTAYQETLLKRIIEKGASKCENIFLAAKEDLSERWWWVVKKKLDINKAHWAENYPRGTSECVVLLRSSLQWKNVDCNSLHCFICEELIGSCFGIGKCMAIEHQMDFHYASIACSNLAGSLATNFPKNMEDIKKFKTAINHVHSSFCPTFYIGLKLKHRIYLDENGEAQFSQFLWKKAPDLQSDCITIKKDDHFKYLHGASCKMNACSICEFQGPDRAGLKDVKATF